MGYINDIKPVGKIYPTGDDKHNRENNFNRGNNHSNMTFKDVLNRTISNNINGYKKED